MEETIEFVANEERRQKIKKLIEEGYRYQCIGCGKIYKQPRQEHCEDGHDGRFIDMCRCGCDLFQKLEEISCLDAKVEPIDSVLVFKASVFTRTSIFKEHHAKYCECSMGKVWTGDAETECGASFELINQDKDKKIFRCLKSGSIIIILKSTEKELKNPDETGSKFLRIPSE